jgi:dTDP-4-amino-4,6-dideoxygalactose transaminase
LEKRTEIINRLKEQSILAVFHYLSLHKSPFYAAKHGGRELPNADRYSDCLLRLPLYYTLRDDDLDLVIETIHRCFA